MRESSLSENEIEESFEDPSQANLEETLDEGLYLQDSLWNRKKKYIETRPKNWLSRFTNDYVPVIPPISPKITPPQEVNYKVVTLTEPEKPRIYAVDELKPFNDVTLQSNFCLVCWKLVIIGPTRIKCLHCPVVVHRYCVANIHDFYVSLEQQEEKKKVSNLTPVKPPSPKKRIISTPTSSLMLPIVSQDTMTESHDSQDDLRDSQSSHLPALKTTSAFRREKTAKPKTRIPVSLPSTATAARRVHRNSEDNLPHLSSSSSSLMRSVVVDTRLDDSTREVRWTCPFCIHEVNVGNDFNSRKYTRLLALHRAKVYSSPPLSSRHLTTGNRNRKQSSKSNLC
jgi:hypothetical protein